jgi:translation initiation factor 1
MGLFDGTALERPVTCSVCDEPADACNCPKNADGDVVLPKDQHPRVRREKRRGKWTTVVEQLDPQATDLAGLVREIKTGLGVGGTTKEGGFELQGDHRDYVVECLHRLGYQAKPSGG